MMPAPLPHIPHRVDDREAVMRRLEVLGGTVEILTAGARRRVEPDIDQRLAALRARVEARRTPEE